MEGSVVYPGSSRRNSSGYGSGGIKANPSRDGVVQSGSRSNTRSTFLQRMTAVRVESSFQRFLFNVGSLLTRRTYEHANSEDALRMRLDAQARKFSYAQTWNQERRDKETLETLDLLDEMRGKIRSCTIREVPQSFVSLLSSHHFVQALMGYQEGDAEALVNRFLSILNTAERRHIAYSQQSLDLLLGPANPGSPKGSTSLFSWIVNGSSPSDRTIRRFGRALYAALHSKGDAMARQRAAERVKSLLLQTGHGRTQDMNAYRALLDYVKRLDYRTNSNAGKALLDVFHRTGLLTDSSRRLVAEAFASTKHMNDRVDQNYAVFSHLLRRLEENKWGIVSANLDESSSSASESEDVSGAEAFEENSLSRSSSSAGSRASYYRAEIRPARQSQASTAPSTPPESKCAPALNERRHSDSGDRRLNNDEDDEFNRQSRPEGDAGSVPMRRASSDETGQRVSFGEAGLTRTTVEVKGDARAQPGIREIKSDTDLEEARPKKALMPVRNVPPAPPPPPGTSRTNPKVSGGADAPTGSSPPSRARSDLLAQIRATRSDQQQKYTDPALIARLNSLGSNQNGLSINPLTTALTTRAKAMAPQSSVDSDSEAESDFND